MTPESTQAILVLEAGILGAILLRPDTLTELPRLEPDDFGDHRHSAIFLAMRNLEARGVPIDVITVEAEVAKWAGHYDHANQAFLGTLVLDVPSADNVTEYARQVRQASLARRVGLGLGEVIAHGMRTAMDGGEMLSAAFAVLASIDVDQPDSASTIAALASKRFKQIEAIGAERLKGGTVLTGYPTGVDSLDEKIGGVQHGIVTIIAARPGMGKSSLGLSVADGSSSAGYGVHVFSLEDTEESYADRTLARASGVAAETMRNAELNRGQCSDIVMAAHKLKGRRWLVDGRSGITAEEIVRSVRRHRRSNDTKVVIVDYVQLVKRPARMSGHEALSEIITTLADAAKQDRLAYVVMSQLNREIEKRQDKRPQLADLRESGSLEERSKCVIGLYRGAYYGDPVKGVDYDPSWKGHAYKPEGDEWEATAQLIVLKNNNGRTGTSWATWHGPTTRLS